MLSQNILAVLSVLTLAGFVSARPYANSTFVSRQIIGAVNDLPVAEILPVNDLPLNDLPLDNLPLSDLLPVNVPTEIGSGNSDQISVPVTIPTEIGSGNSGQNAGGSSSNSGTISNDMTVGQAATTCGNSQLNCCNSISNSGDTTNSGVLGAIFGSGDIAIQCVPINIPLVGGMDRFLSHSLQITDSRCAPSPSPTQHGLRCKGCVLSRRHYPGIFILRQLQFLRMLTNILVERPGQCWLRGRFISHLARTTASACIFCSFSLLASFFSLDLDIFIFSLAFFLDITFVLISLQTSNSVYYLPLSYIKVLLLLKPVLLGYYSSLSCIACSLPYVKHVFQKC